MNDYQYFKDEIKWLRQELDLFRSIFDSISGGALITDNKGIITHFNEPLGKLLELDAESQIGKHCQQVITGSRMQQVAKTGIAETDVTHLLNGKQMIVQRIPIIREGRVVAVFGQVISEKPEPHQPEETLQTGEGEAADTCPDAPDSQLHIKQAQQQAERLAIQSALKANRNNKTKAAEQLGIHRTLLYKKMKKLKLPL